MNDMAVSGAQGVAAAGREGRRAWLLLIHQLPAEPAYLRVKTLRRLKALGALALKNSVYVLPDGDASREDFHWLRREILAGGGDATLSVTQWVEGASDTELEDAFSAERGSEYDELAGEVEELERSGGATREQLERLRRRLAAIEQRDHFGAAARHSALGALAAAERRLGGDAVEEGSRVQDRPSGGVWVTRAGARVDRIASAWLIRRFIDPAARFRFVSPEDYEHARGELRFDMYEGEYTHEGEACTFETLLLRFGLTQPALRAIGEIVHDVDCKDEKFGRAETAGVASIVDGIAALHARDEDRVEASAQIFDGLLAKFRSSAS